MTIYQCDRCPYTVLSNDALLGHVNRVHLHKRPFACEAKGCNFTGFDKSSLRQHTLYKHLPPKLSCAHCDKLFHRNRELINHTNTVHLKIFTYFCEDCDYKANKSNHMEHHKKTVHLKIKNFSCPLCNALFSTMQDVIRHLTSKSHGLTKKEAQLRCKDMYTKHMYEAKMEDSSENMDSATDAESENTTPNSQISPVLDSEANAASSTVSKAPLLIKTKNRRLHIQEENTVAPVRNSARHIKQILQAETMIHCKTCSKDFEKPNKLERHRERKHNDLSMVFKRPFRCDKCKKRFSTEGKRSRHVKKKHVEVVELSDSDVVEISSSDSDIELL